MSFQSKRAIHLSNARKRRRQSGIGRLFAVLHDDDEESGDNGDESGHDEIVDESDDGKTTDDEHSNVMEEAEESFPRCDNCSRMGIELHGIEKENVNFRLKFSCVKKKEFVAMEQLFLCNECRTMLTDKSQSVRPDVVWPSFVRKALEQHGTRAWVMLPQKWREWWLDFAVVRQSLNVGILQPPLKVAELSKEHVEFCEMMGNLGETSFRRFKATVEATLAVPRVRCPWGCSEFVGRTNSMPLDVFFSGYLDGLLTYTKSKNSFTCVRGFRQDLFEGQVEILSNPSWKCMPAIVDDGAGPKFQSCRFHTSKDRMKYLHPPRNPTGHLSFSDDNNFSQVVAVPRTVRAFRSNKFTNSYQINKALGSYSGLDTMNLTTELYNTQERSALGVHRTVITMSGRPDFKNFVQDFKANRCKTELDTVGCDSLLQNSKTMLREGLDLEKQAAGSTFVPLREAFEQIQTSKLHGGSRTIVTTEEKEVAFVPPWPRRLHQVMTVGDRHGDTFEVYGGFQGEQNSHKWLMCNLMHVVPEIWAEIEQNCTSEARWEGWALGFVYYKIVHKLYGKRRGKGNNPFKATDCKVQKLESVWSGFETMRTRGDWSFTCSFLSRLLMYPSICVTKNYPATVETRLKVVIIVYDPMETETAEIRETLGSLRLRVIATTEKGSREMFVRRASPCESYWRCASMGNRSNVRKDYRDPQLVMREERKHWKVLVYCDEENLEELRGFRETMIRLNGGQTAVHCIHHNLPLVTSPFHSRNACSTQGCSRICSLICPSASCCVGFCKDHGTEKEDDCSSSNDSDYEFKEMHDVPLLKDDESFSSAESELSFKDSSPRREELSDLHGLDGLSESSFDDGSDDGSLNSSKSFRSDSTGDFLTWAAEDEEGGFGDEISSHEESNVEEDFGDMPITNAGKPSATFDLAGLIKTGKMIPNHVLLNTDGNLLIRCRKNIRATTAARHFLQTLVATSPEKVHPLAYPEAMLNPSLFYYALPDGSMAGAIPVSLLQDRNVLASSGVASLYDMARTRLLDPSLLSSTNSVYQCFMWDMVANLSLRGVSPEVFWRRGFIGVPGYDGFTSAATNEPLYDSQYIDSRAAVNQLAAANGKRACDLFFTFTCNQTMTMGVRLLTEWTRSEEAIDIVRREAVAVGCQIEESDLKERDAIAKALEESSCAYVVRCWNEIVQVFLKYLQFGKDSPFRNVGGGIENIFDRGEIQSDVDGKVPHHHLLIYLRSKAKNSEEILSVLELIRGSAENLFTEEEWKQAKEKGFVAEGDLYEDFMRQVEQLLHHHCTSRCMVKTRCQNTDGSFVWSTERKCKQPDIRLASPSPSIHCFKNVEVNHSEEAIQCMLWLGLTREERDPNTGALLFRPLEKYKFLQSKKHFPPCFSTTGPFSPANPFLFAMLMSAINLQYCTTYVLLRYLTKYVASMDKAVKFQVKASDDGHFPLESTDDHNTKITGNRLEAEKRKATPFRLEGRNLSMAELLMQMLKYPMITTTFKFEYIPTQNMAARPMLKRTPVIQKLKATGQVPVYARRHTDLNAGTTFPGYRARKSQEFAAYRNFDNYQRVLFLDSFFQPGSLDKVTIFGLRPPELRWVDKLSLYFSIFARKPLKGYHAKDVDAQATHLIPLLHQDQRKCPWIDATGNQIYIRAAGIQKALRYLRDMDHGYVAKYFVSVTNHVDFVRLLEDLNTVFFGATRTQTRHNINEGEEMRKRFTLEEKSETYTQLPIYWYRTTRASDTENFLYHLLLSMGRFTTELELLSQGSLKKAFQSAGLLTYSIDSAKKEKSIQQLATNYVVEQLSHHPMGTRYLDTELVTAVRTLNDFLLNDAIFSASVPSALFTKIRTECLEDIETYCYRTQLNLVESFSRNLSTVFDVRLLPTITELFPSEGEYAGDFSPFNLPRNEHQSQLSFEEHTKGYEIAGKMVDHYQKGSLYRTKSLALVGGGGVGKSMAARTNGLWFLTKGLTVVCTTLMGKRASEFGSEHLHIRFKLRAANSGCSIAQRAEEAIRNLLKDPKRYELLRRMDILIIDELGQIDAATLAVIDLILRRIRKSTHFFGGVVVLATMDVKQLRPIKGLPPVMMPSMLSTFLFHQFLVPLRTADAVLQRIQEITRLDAGELDKSETKHEFIRLISDNCMFVESLADSKIPANATYCFPRRAPCRVAEQKVLERLRRQHEGAWRWKTATDWEETQLAAYPVPASAVTSKALDTEGKTPQVISFFPGAAYEVTFNDPSGTFYQSQICVMTDVPSQEAIDAFELVELLRAPPGIDELPACTDRESLSSAGWISIKVGKEPERRRALGQNGLFGFREQYGLKHRISSTIHAIMGSAAAFLVTQIGITEDDSLWEAAQVVVLLSRTHFAKDICFVGEACVVAKALYEALLSGDQYSEFINHVLKSLLTSECGQFSLALEHQFPYRMKDWQLPKKGNLCCYFLLSLGDRKTTYIGQTENLARRFNSHNSRMGGSKSTNRLHLKPWAILGYVEGFDSRNELQEFEKQWQLKIEIEQTKARGNLRPKERFNLCRNMCKEGQRVRMCIGETHN
jgi:predicted GIY-YIG superfamily endonuclease